MTRLRSWLVITTIMLLSFSTIAGQLDTEDKKASYGFGVDFANNLKRQGVELDIDALVLGIKDASKSKKLALSDNEMTAAKTSFQNQLREKLLKKQQAIADKNEQEGKAFLKQNAKKEGVKTTESGLQYKIIKAGDGDTPGADDTVVTHYRGTLIDGREFDSSYKRGQPATFPVKGVIPGWTEALQMMKVGAKWQLFIPAELAYGSIARSELIQANSTLLFELELLEIKGPVDAGE